MALREVLADLSVRVRGMNQLRVADQGVTGLVGKLRGASSALMAVGGAFAGAFAVRQVSSFVGELVDLGDELGKTSQQLGLTTDQLQAWRFAADRGGVDGRAMAQSFMRLQRAAYEAGRGTKTYLDAFNELGINVRGSNGQLLDADELMMRMAGAMHGLTDESQKVALAQVLMGRSGARLLPVLNGGTEGVEALMKRFRELGGGLSGDFVQDAEDAQDALTDWNLSMMSFKSMLGASFLPALTRALNSVSEWAAGASRWIRSTHALSGAMEALEVTLGAVAVAMLAAFWEEALIAAGFAALFLVVQDLVVMFQGGKSAIGEFLDSMFGLGAAHSVVETLTNGWKELLLTIRQVLRALGIIDEESNFGGAEVRQMDEARMREIDDAMNATQARSLGAAVLAPRARGPLGGIAGLQAASRALAAGPSVPVSAVTNNVRNEQRIDVRPTTHVTINGAQDLQAVAHAVRDVVDQGVDRALARHAGRAAGELPQGRSSS